MYQITPLTSLEDYFLPHSQRKSSAVYSSRIQGTNPEIQSFLSRYLVESQSRGLLQEVKLPNPSPNHISYYQEVIGNDFHFQQDFFQSSLKKWLPRLSQEQNQIIASAIYTSFAELQQQGKNLNILKNLFIKFMCWMYYRLEQLLRQLGKDQVPKILYQGNISDYELRIFTVCLKAGCDVVLLQYEGDSHYEAIDPQNHCSLLYTQGNSTNPISPFPTGFSLEQLRQQQAQQVLLSRLYQGLSLSVVCNQWQKGTAFEDVLLENTQRNSNHSHYSLYRYVCGVEDKSSYVTELYRLYEKLQSLGREVLVLESLPSPSPEEIEKINKRNYRDTIDLIGDFAKKISFPKSPDLQKLMVKAYVDALQEDSQFQAEPQNRQVNQALYLLVWLQRYQSTLFGKWTTGKLACCFSLQGAQKPVELLFYRMLSKLPVDLIVLAPNLNAPPLEDSLALIERYPQSLELGTFPKDLGQIGTMAYHAERDLDQIIYQDSGIYRSHQYKKAKMMTLQTMYEEIAILWQQETTFRPNFWTQDEQVHVPLLFAKVSGVPEGNISGYWSMVKSLVTPDTLVASQVPFIENNSSNPFLGSASSLYSGTKLQRKKITEHQSYGYGFLRQEVQEHILDKIELFLSLKPVKGMGVNGTEYTALALALTLPTQVLRLIQGFDFTKVPPKLLYLHCKETMPSVEDAIFLALLNLLGFDIVMFVPTGYQGVETHYNTELFKEHQVGDYLYDLTVPKLNPQQKKPLNQLKNKFFKRGE